MNIKHVILAGDSAGAHLALTVNFLAILRGFRRPDALLVHYPVGCVDINRFFPSQLLSVDEEMLSQPFLKFALACFMRSGGNPDKSPLCSPILAPDALIRLLPPLRIFSCEIDSLRDNAFFFTHRILTANNVSVDQPYDDTKAKVRIFYMRDYIHGFCNLDTKHVGVEEYQKGTQITIREFRYLFLNLDLSNSDKEIA